MKKVMKIYIKSVLLLSCIMTLMYCNNKTAPNEVKGDERTSIEMFTDYGKIIIELYNETPLHRDNFIKLANENTLDSLLFHRVIENFMIQGGDIDSKNAQQEDTLGRGSLPYKVPAEITIEKFHKKGVIAAARGDSPERESSSTQFYLVQGKVLNDSLLDHAESRINEWLSEHYFKNDIDNKPLMDALQEARENNNWDTFTIINDSIKSLAKTYEKFEKYSIPEEHQEVYKTIGGTPHLDQNYTVFGEVVSGLDIVDSIAAVKTGTLNRPVNDVRILTVRVLN
jgi:peptidyl-prolyl cis-trans isomerase B (cyclophilin B)